jgi:hypothetical protein
MTQWGLDTLFNPAKRHMDDEKHRLQSTREEVGDNSGGKRVDFESGKVTIRRAATSDDDAAETDAADADGTNGTGEKSKAAKDGAGSAKDSAKPKPSAAAVRAAERRGRQPR